MGGPYSVEDLMCDVAHIRRIRTCLRCRCAVRVAAVADKREGTAPEARTPLEGLSPTAFFTEWPHGEMEPPAEFEEFAFTTPSQREALLKGVELLRVLVLDYRHYVSTRSRERVSQETGLSTNTLSNFNGGTRFPRLSTYLALRANIPEHTRAERSRDRQAARRREEADAKWVDEEIQGRIDFAVQRRVDDALRRRGPGR
jgi:hypothetical protein